MKTSIDIKEITLRIMDLIPIGFKNKITARDLQRKLGYKDECTICLVTFIYDHIINDDTRHVKMAVSPHPSETQFWIDG